ncbi:hypothetical protein [Phyllobacterium meliloti]|uniref:hypothetical protein n=1 Tax=Phyllobacterium meliloti TaxID=555317 RepID=UPI001D14E4C3|nr:hypothetical protein [Phyllobacterium sp. T1293]UGX87106.1 hypothetical protein LLE53_004465 [Phyllobacterium sp. T1293]
MNPNDPSHFTHHHNQRPSESDAEYCTRVLATALRDNKILPSLLHAVVHWAYDRGFNNGSQAAGRYVDSQIQVETQPLVEIINNMKAEMTLKMITHDQADAAIIAAHRDGLNKAAALFEEDGVPSTPSVMIDGIPDLSKNLASLFYE